MKNTITLALALTLICSTFTFAQDKSLQYKVQRGVEISRYETPQEIRDRVLNELKPNPDYNVQNVYKLLVAKNDLINHYETRSLSYREREALELYNAGYVHEAYTKLGFNLDQAIDSIDWAKLYQKDSFDVHFFQWPVDHRFENAAAYLEFNRLAAARQGTIQIVKEKVEELSEKNQNRALRSYALAYYETMDKLINRYTLGKSTKKEKEAIVQYQSGNVRDAYETLGFVLDIVVKAENALDFYEDSMHPHFFKWPVEPNSNK